MDLIIKIAGFSVIAAIAAAVVRKQLPEISLVLLICAGCAVLLLAVDAIDAVVRFVSDVSVRAKISGEVMSPLMKIAGISIVSKLSADVCRDAGSISLASCVELAGGAVGVALSLPLMMSVIELIASL